MGFIGAHFFVNFVLIAIPIGATLGILFGIDAQRSSNGEPPVYSPPASPGNGGNGNGGGGSDNRLTTKTYCQQSFGITPITKGQEFTLNPNQWGWDPSEGGGLCMNVTTYDNSTYPTKTTAPAWSITWEYPPGPETQPVHAFPNVLVDGGVFPATVASLAHIGFDVRWSYGVGNTTAPTTNEASLAAESLNANVAVDMFLDSNKKNAGNSSKAAYEVMVWFADFGSAAQPIGLQTGAVTTETVNGTTFSLYSGQNGLKQTVLTWLASETTDTFSGDLRPLLTKLFTLNEATYPSETDYLGYFAFGSEAYYSNDFVTFSVPHLSIDVTTS
ncbi:xyloglucan-specific endoglucanase [Niveomyces insectorum RCEF 264]|uniref:Xyloglucan-specific endoglucanase n=1 Tax=Niveomyces insectorum RCEF 264 TaxID=1081102 RepID=A0A167MHE6_9HYPO|nr:xyloglucan-specific endoglucanase [Niveomyces insectorum RCEF 264]